MSALALPVTVPHPAGSAPGEMPGAAGGSHAAIRRNLNGQKLGRKGELTRARILDAASELIAEDSDVPLSCSAIARRAALSISSLYVYFNDLSQIILALLEPVKASAGEMITTYIRPRWSDETLDEDCRAFVAAYLAFWQRHAPLLHLRNSMADFHDDRLMEHRIHSAQPLILALARQMDGDPDQPDSIEMGMAATLMTGLERSMTVWTHRRLNALFDTSPAADTAQRQRLAARLLELSIRDVRDMHRDAC